MRALVTGLGGFTGRYVERELLSAGWEVFGMGSQLPSTPVPAPSTPTSQSRHYQADLNDLAQLGKIVAAVKPQVVIHLAAIAFVGHQNADAFYTTNLIGTRNLLQAIAEHAVPDAVILASSANIYGNAAGGVLDETTPMRPANDYAVSKAAMELMAQTWQARLPLIITRPFNYTGVGQSAQFLIPKIVDHFRARAPAVELGNLDVWRDFSDVRSVALAYRLLAEQRPVGNVFNVASGKAWSLREIIGLAERLTGHQLQVTVNPAFVRANEVRSLCGDPARLHAALDGWSSLPLEETLAWMLNA